MHIDVFHQGTKKKKKKPDYKEGIKFHSVFDNDYDLWRKGSSRLVVIVVGFDAGNTSFGIA